MRRCLFILTWVLLVQFGFSQPQYRFQHFDTRDGLASDLSVHIIQDSLGFLWIDCGSAKTRYDGYNFKVYNRDPEDPSISPSMPESNGMVLDNSGNLWILPMNPAKYYELSKYDRNLDGFALYKADLKGTMAVHTVRFEENDKSVWLATSTGLSTFNLDIDHIAEVKNFSIDLSDSLARSMSNYVFDIIVRDSLILLATEKGLWEFDKNQKKFRRPLCIPKDSSWLYNTAFFTILSDQKFNSDDIWLVDDRAFSRINKNGSLVQRLDLPGGRSGVGVMGFDRDREGVFWIGTWNKGVCRYDPADSSIVFIKNIPGDVYSLRSDNTQDVKVDRDQNIWVTTFRGTSRLKRQDVVFYNTELPGAGRSGVSTVFQSGGVDYVLINKNDGEHHVMIAPVIPGHLDSLNFQQAIPTFQGAQLNGFWKGKRNFWITAWGLGVVSVPIDSKTGMVLPGPMTTLSHDPENYNTISSNLTTSPWEDDAGNLWIGSINGLNKIIPDIPYGTKGSVIRYNHIEGDSTSIIDDHVLGFYPEDAKSFWISTLAGVDLYSNNKFQHFFLNNRQPRNIHKSSDGILSIATGSGLFEGFKNNGKYTFKKSPFLKNADIVGINEDQLGRLWISTKQGIIFYDRKEQLAIEFNEMDGFIHKRMPHSAFRPNLTSHGIMVIADFDGLSLFDPSSLRVNRAKTFPVLTRLSINNELPAIGTKLNAKDKFSIKSDISVLDELVLDYKHNNFTIEFSSMELTAPEKNLYRHKLQGYDPDWIETDWKSRTATYTNLDAGNYVFKVKASNYHGIWNDNEATLNVVILPPPWKTWWAYTLYGLALFGIVLYWRNYEIKRVRLKQRAEHLTELDNLKTRFFANISHEFRTPITLILGPLKDLYNKAAREDQKALFGVMIRNGQRLLRLINQLLDLSKLEAGKMHLHIAPVDLVEFLREIAASYESLATDKRIKYSYTPEVQQLITYIDKEKLEKVIHNILSNAFKFTNPGGEVILMLQTEESKWALIAVKDTGIGIPEEQSQKVFDRFYQVDNSQTRGYEGSGLGMALAKEMVELHQGRISFESAQGKGTTFTVWIPLGKQHLRKEDILELEDQKKAETISEDLFLSENGGAPEHEKQTIPSDHQPVLLIVEDNPDMRNYIRKTLNEHYQIAEAVNGKEGVKKAQEIVPDLIISDIMMPEMDGYKLCEQIKTHELTSHIPVILLTAKADRESKLTGLETGADDYLSKPFDADELKLIVRNRIEERRKMRERFSREITLEPKQISITSLDEKFLKKVLDIIEVHMDDESFSMGDLSEEAGYSHIHFYRKIKGLSGQAPNQFLRTIRLKRAAELLRKKSDNVAQIAYSVGFNSQSYFIKCFKEQFGMTPGQFVESNAEIK